MKKTQNDQGFLCIVCQHFMMIRPRMAKKQRRRMEFLRWKSLDAFSKYARQFDQAENRLHSIKAIMAVTAGDLFIPKV